MAVNYNNSSNFDGPHAVKKIGIKQSVFDWLTTEKVVIKLTAKEFTFTHDGTFVIVPVALNDLQLLAANKLPLSNKVILGQKIEQALAQTWAGVPAGAAPAQQAAPKHFIPPAQKVPVDGAMTGKLTGAPEHLLNKVQYVPIDPALKSALSKAKEEGIQSKPGVTVVATKGWPVFDLTKINSAPVTKLRDAAMMYQPVASTSPDSRYFMIAAGDNVRVAARYKDASLSVRIEGDNLPKWKAMVTACGFSPGNKGGAYASLHLAVGTDLMTANKTLGAILMGLGIPFETPLPNLKLIKA